MPALPNHLPTDYHSALNPWQSLPEQGSLSWLHSPLAGTGMGAGMGNVQNGMRYPDAMAPPYDGPPADDATAKRSTIEYQPNDNGEFKKEPEDESPDSILPEASNIPSASSTATTPVDTMPSGSMNPPSILPAKSAASVSFNTIPLPLHLQNRENMRDYGGLIRTESLPQIHGPYASCNVGLPSTKKDAVVESFVPPQMPARAMSEFNLNNIHINRPTVEFGPVLPKRPPAYESYIPPPKRLNVLPRSYSQPNIHVASHHPNTTLDTLMTILDEDLPGEPEPSAADVFKPHDSDIILPQNTWGGYYPEPGQLSQHPAISMPVLSEGDRYPQNYYQSSVHIQHVMRNSEPHLNQLPIQGGYPSRVSAIDRPPAQIVKPPEILEASGGQESDQSSECSIIHYENRRNLLNSTGGEQRRSDGSDSLARTALHNFTGSLPNLANFGGEFGGNCIYPRMDHPDSCDPCDSVFSPVSGVGPVSRFDFNNIRDGVKTSSSSTQVRYPHPYDVA